MIRTMFHKRVQSGKPPSDRAPVVRRRKRAREIVPSAKLLPPIDHIKTHRSRHGSTMYYTVCSIWLLTINYVSRSVCVFMLKLIPSRLHAFIILQRTAFGCVSHTKSDRLTDGACVINSFEPRGVKLKNVSPSDHTLSHLLGGGGISGASTNLKRVRETWHFLSCRSTF